jgi:hypothetical protein
MADWNGDLDHWLAPFLARLGHKARRRMCPLYVAGLIGPGCQAPFWAGLIDSWCKGGRVGGSR